MPAVYLYLAGVGMLSDEGKQFVDGGNPRWERTLFRKYDWFVLIEGVSHVQRAFLRVPQREFVWRMSRGVQNGDT